MIIRYRDHFDSTRPTLMPEQEINETGILYLGPEGLLRCLEQRLGIIPEGCTQAERVYTYLDALGECAGSGKGEPFYSRSFGADPFGTARDLLTRRDELALAGWDFTPENGLPRRLKDFAAVERISAVPQGFPDRLGNVRKELETLPPDVGADVLYLERITAPAKELLPEWTVRLFELLEEKEIVVTEEDAPVPAPAETDLGRFQRVLSGVTAEGIKEKGKLRLSGDGTLQILRGSSGTELAAYCARKYSDSPDTLMIVPESDTAVLSLLGEDGAPSPGIRTPVAASTALQIPVLLPVFLYDPPDPYALLDFLNLPESPLPKQLTRKLAAALTAVPGTGTNEWKEALAETLEEAEAEKHEYLKGRYETYFGRKRGTASPGCSAGEAVILFEDTAAWARKKQHAGGEDGIFARLYSCCSRTAEILKNRKASNADLPHRELIRIIESALPRGYFSLREAGKSRMETASSPEDITGPAESAVWLPFHDDGILDPSFDFWSPEERKRLKGEGVSLPVPAGETEKSAEMMRRGICRIHGKLVLCIPGLLRGEEVRPHPFSADLETAFTNPGDITFAPGGEPGSPGDMFTNSGPVPLPRPVRYWELEEPVGPRETESPSSLENLFLYPFIWFLKYKAHIRPGGLAGFPSGNLLYGTLFHRLVNRILLSRKEFENIDIEALISGTVADEGLTLLLPGNETERLSVERTFARGLRTLFSVLRGNGWIIAGSEEHTEGTFAGMPAAGYIDLRCSRGNEVLIVDMKWSGRSYRMDSLADGTDYQLALYSSLARGPGIIPDTAYFIIREGVFLARDTGSIREALTPPSGGGSRSVYPGLWERMERTCALRMEELDAGRVEVPVAGTEPDPEQAGRYGDALPPPEEGPRFNDYTSLCGWEEQ